MSSAGNSTIQILPKSGSSPFDPIVHIFNGTPDSTKGYNVINVLISAAFPVYVRVLQSIFNGGPWDDIEYFDYGFQYFIDYGSEYFDYGSTELGQGMFITVPIRAEWFYVSVENRAIVNNNIRLQTIKKNSDLVGSVVGVTGGVNITNLPSFFGITGVAGITGFVTTAGRDETLKTNTIYVDTTGAQRTTIVPARKDNAKYIYEMDLDQIIEPLPVDGWSLDPRGRDGWYFSGNAQSSLTWYGNANQLFAPPVVPFNMLKSVYFVATMGNTMILPKISITTYYINTNTLAYTWEYNIDTVVNIYNGETYLFYCGNNALNLHTSYRHVPMNSNRVIGPGNEYVHDIKVIAPANSQFLLERAGICDPSGNYETVFDTNKDIIVRDKLSNLDFCGSYLNTLISGSDGVNIYPIYTDASGILLTKLTGASNTYIGITGMVGVSGFYNDGLVGVTGSSAITVPADTYIGITGMVGVSGFYNGGLVGVTGSSAITVPANTFIGITGMVGVSGFYNGGLVGVTGSSAITVPANTFIGITGMVGVSGFYNGGLVGVTGSSAITVPANTFIGITGMVGVSGFYNGGLVGVTGSSAITVPANTFIGITGMVGVSGLYRGLVGVTGSSAITVPANTFIGITGMVGVSGYYNGLVGVTGSSVITVPANTFIGITGMVGVSGYYNGLVGVTGSSVITVPANTFIGITGMVGVSGFYNDGLVGVTGSSAITVPANTFIGITGMVGISGMYNGLVGVTGSATIFGRDYIGGNTNTIYLDSKGVQITQLAKTDTNTVEYNFYTDLNNLVISNSLYFSLDKDRINDGWYYDATSEVSNKTGSFFFYGDNTKFYKQPDCSLNNATIWAIISCKNTNISKSIAPPRIVVSTTQTGGLWRYSVPADVKLYNGVSYLFYYGSKAIELNPSYTPILLTRTPLQQVPPITHDINVNITRISIYLGEYVAPEDRDARNTTYLVKNAGLWDSNLNTSFVAEFGPKFSNIQVVGGTDGLLKYPIYTDVCGVQRTQIIETYKPPYKFILETDAPDIVQGTRTEFTTDPRNRDGWYNTTYNIQNSLKWFDNSSAIVKIGHPITCNVDTLELWMIVTCMSTSGSSHVAPKMQIMTNINNTVNYIPSMTKVYNNIPYLFYYGNKPPLINPNYTAVILQRTGTISSTVKTITILKEISNQFNTSYLIDSAGFWDPVNKQEFSVQFRSNTSNSPLYALDASVGTCDTVTYTLVNETLSTGGTRAHRSLDTYINNASTTNGYGKSGLNMYQIYPKKIHYVLGGLNTYNEANALMGHILSKLITTTYNYGINNPKVWYAYSDSGVARTLTYDYVDSTGKLWTNQTKTLTNTVTTLGNGSNVVSVNKWSLSGSGDEVVFITIGNPSNEYSIAGGRMRFQDYGCGLITIPNNYVGYISNFSVYSPGGNWFNIMRWDAQGNCMLATTHYNSANAPVTAGFNGSIGGIFETGSSIAVSRLDGVSSGHWQGTLVLEPV